MAVAIDARGVEPVDSEPESRKTDPGAVGLLYANISAPRDTNTVLSFDDISLANIRVGVMPDMVTFTPNGKRIWLPTKEDGGDPESEDCKSLGDLGPEGILFIPKAKSPPSPNPGKPGETNKAPLLSVTNEVSGTTTLYRIDRAQGDDD